jgi:hypothetical protein
MARRSTLRLVSPRLEAFDCVTSFRRRLYVRHVICMWGMSRATCRMVVVLPVECGKRVVSVVEPWLRVLRPELPPFVLLH